MFKRILSLLIITVLVLAFTITSVSAAEPRYVVCDNCGGRTVDVSKYVWGNWKNYSTVTCTHGTGGYDTLQRRTGTHTYRECESCGYKWTKTVTQTRTVCNG